MGNLNAMCCSGDSYCQYNFSNVLEEKHGEITNVANIWEDYPLEEMRKRFPFQAISINFFYYQMSSLQKDYIDIDELK